jgi:hypothetical protein
MQHRAHIAEHTPFFSLCLMLLRVCVNCPRSCTTKWQPLDDAGAAAAVSATAADGALLISFIISLRTLNATAHSKQHNAHHSTQNTAQHIIVHTIQHITVHSTQYTAISTQDTTKGQNESQTHHSKRVHKTYAHSSIA